VISAIYFSPGRLKGAAVVRHSSEFYLLEPSSKVLRPNQRRSIPGLALAGDCTSSLTSAVWRGPLSPDAGQRSKKAGRRLLWLRHPRHSAGLL